MTMTPEQIEMHRERFEDWFRRIYMNSPMVRDGDTYTTAHCALKWQVWLSAIDSLVVELPSRKYIVDGLPERTINYADTVAIIEFQGIKVRP